MANLGKLLAFALCVACLGNENYAMVRSVITRCMRSGLPRQLIGLSARSKPILRNYSTQSNKEMAQEVALDQPVSARKRKIIMHALLSPLYVVVGVPVVIGSGRMVGDFWDDVVFGDSGDLERRDES